MRKTQMLPIGYDKKRDSYYYKERVAAFPTTQVSEGELICLCGMMQAMAPFRNTPFAMKLRPLIDKFIEGMPPELKVSFRTLEQRISFRQTGIDAHLDPTIFETVIAALLKNEELAIDYVKMHYEEEHDGTTKDAKDAKREVVKGSTAADAAGAANDTGQVGRSRRERRDNDSPDLSSSTPERRTIEPVHLACVDNGWYLFAYDPAREKIRRFLLTRTNAVRVTGRRFKPRAFDIDVAMAPSFGIFDGDGVPVDVRIRFRDKGVRLIQERSWHRSESIEQLADGTVVLGLRVAHTPQLEGWVLHWGRLAKVLEPAALREGVEQQARGVLEPWPDIRG
jgi:predicted DNA-binding transcriptional regulator YafY